ncbi:MAG TPA: heparinase II/III family protein [Rhizomicrobium sp.]|jgi:hypothetical protein
MPSHKTGAPLRSHEPAHRSPVAEVGRGSSDSAATPRRRLSISIVPGNSAAAEDLWAALGAQFEKKGKLSLVRAEDGEGDAAIYLVRGEDICDRNSAQRTVGTIRRAPARLKLAVEANDDPHASPSPLFRQVLATLDADKSEFLVDLPERQKLEKKSKKESPGSDNPILQLQAKAIARILKSEDAAAGQLDAVSDAPKEKTKRRKQARNEQPERVPAEPKQEKRKKKQRRAETGRDASDEGEQSGEPMEAGAALKVAILANAVAAKSLMSALTAVLAEAGNGIVEADSDSRADLIVAVWERSDSTLRELSEQISQVQTHRRTQRIFVPPAPRAGSDDGEAGQEILRLAAAHGAVVVDLAESGRDWAEQAAAAIGNILASQGVGNGRPTPAHQAPRPDLLELAALAEKPAAFLAALSSDGKSLPQSLRAPPDLNAMEAFVESTALIRTGRRRARKSETGEEAETLSLELPIGWSLENESVDAKRYLLGLEFLAPVLSYWFLRASNSKDGDVAKIDRALKEKGITASFLLNRAGEIIADFAGANPAHLPPQAWNAAVVSGRVRALMLFLLCAKIASQRRINFDEARCGPALLALLDGLEWLRHPDWREPVSPEAIEHEGFLVAVASLIGGTPYGSALIAQTLARLKRFQIEAGLSADGVWAGGFGDHCTVLSSLAEILSGLQAHKLSDASILSDAIRRMGPFAAAMLKSDGCAPALDDNPSRSFGRSLTQVRATLRSADKPDAAASATEEGAERLRAAGTHVFPAAGYLISHSAKKPHPRSSQLVFHALAQPPAATGIGGLSLSFSIGPADLLVGGGVTTRKASEAVREASRMDQAAHNSFRVNGKSYDRSAALRGIAFEQFWTGDDWAAAAASNRAYEDGGVTRTVIHLKKHNALIVVDELAAKTEEAAEFEQFWHLAPPLAPNQEPLCFASDRSGALVVAVDGQDTPSVERGDESNPLGWTRDSEGEVASNFYLRRGRRTVHGAMATLFCWMPEYHPVFVDLSVNGVGAWSVRAGGAEFDAQFTFAENRLVSAGS